SPADYRAFVLPHTRRVIGALRPGVPVIHFGVGTGGLLPLMKEAGGDVIGLDWRVELGPTWARLGHDVAVQGNLDPAVLLADVPAIRRAARAMLDAVLLIAFGGPERPEDVRPFLQLVTAGRRIPPERLEEVAHHYDLMGGRSPLNDLTRRQAEALRAALAAEGRTVPVWVGMRNWHPFLHETLAEMKDRGCRRALGIILSSLQTEASWLRYVEDVAAAREKVGP